MTCKLGCTTMCKAKEAGCASECPALPWQPLDIKPAGGTITEGYLLAHAIMAMAPRRFWQFTKKLRHDWDPTNNEADLRMLVQHLKMEVTVNKWYRITTAKTRYCAGASTVVDHDDFSGSEEATRKAILQCAMTSVWYPA